MHFVYPWFLLAFLVLAIPVIIHLFQFRRAKTVLFPSIRFLKQVQNEEKNQERLKHLLVLAMRIIAFSALVLAFAVPFWGGTRKSGNEKTYVAVFLDNSLSMDARSSKGFVFEEAKNKTRELIKSFGNTAMFQVMGNDPDAAHTRFVNEAEAIRLVDELKISSKTTEIEKVRYRLEQSLTEQPGDNKVLYLISDMQRSLFVGGNLQPHNKAIEVFAISVNRDQLPNLTLDTAWLANPFALAGEKNTLFFEVKNYSDKPQEEVTIKLLLAENLRGNTSLNVPAGGTATGSVSFSMPAAEEGRGRLVLEDASMPFDNTLYFTLNITGSTPVKIIEPSVNPYLASAIKTATFLKAEAKGSVWKDIKSNAPVVWTGITAVSENQAAEISEVAQAGARVILVPDRSAGSEVFEGLQKAIGFPAIIKKDRTRSKLKRENLQHPFFKQVFVKLPQTLEMPTLFEYLRTGGNTGNGEAILSTETGEPFLLSFSQGKGKVFVFLSAWQPEANNFVQSTLFYPVFANAILKTEGLSRLYETTASGRSLMLSRDFDPGENNFELKGESETYVPEISAGGGYSQLFIGSHLNKAGYYTLLSKNNKKDFEYLALNYSRKESDPQTASSEEIEPWLKNSNITTLDEKLSVAGNLVQEKAKNYWKIFVWIAAIALLFEILIITFWSRLFASAKPQPQTR